MEKTRPSSFILSVVLLTALAVSLTFSGSFADEKADASKDQKVTFNFVDVDLTVITKFISEITKKNFIFDERVKGKITIIAPSKLSIDDAYNLFTSVLELKGFTVVPSGINAYKIIPSAEAKQRGLRIESERKPVNESYIARVIPLKNISSDDALKFVQPMISKDGYVSAFGPGNLLLVIDSGLNVDKILSLVETIDQPSLMERPEIVFLQYSSADTVAKILTDGMRKTKATPQPMTGEEAKAVADPRLNAVVLFGDKGMRESMKSLIALLDVPAPGAQGRINVYFLENADATDLAKVLEGIIRGAQTQRQTQPGTPPVTPFEAAGGITITADKASNSLIVVASPADYQNIAQVIRQLDKRRRQVYVEAMIIEATVNKLKELGAQWRATAKVGGNPVTIGGFGTIDNAAIQGIVQGLQGATLGGLGNFLNIPITTTDQNGNPTTTTLSIPGFAVLFQLNEFNDVINVLSTPQVLTSDNKEAEILVGQNVPFITQSSTTTGLGVTTTGTSVQGVVNSIVRQDVGIILKITPQITEGDHVKLDIYLENSAVVNQSTQITVSVGPTINKRSTKTAVVVKDNEIVVIGGLLQDNDEAQITKVPLLGDIPLVGQLFQSKTTSKSKTNLIVFLNPHIIKESERLAEITKKKQTEFAVASQSFAERELLVKFKEGVTQNEALSIISLKGASLIGVIEGTMVYHIQLPKGLSVEDAVKEFSALPEVQYAEPNYMLKMPTIK
ncbi:MAG TPA: type II secretion system secretin GspD [Thermodesulfovibrionales bacterium]|nr:type II secretion system secretin GspD [Thermodesulfovibrionales bacterium]